jgi:hypothetical protein
MHNVCSPAQTGEAADYKLQVYARFPKGDQPKCPIKTIASHPPTRTQPQRGEARKYKGVINIKAETCARAYIIIITRPGRGARLFICFIVWSPEVRIIIIPAA